MIVLQQGARRFQYRTVGVALRGGQVLIQRGEQDDFWALPGGRVELMETAADALRREMQEEWGADVRVERLLWLVENFFPFQGVAYHELACYFLMALPADSPVRRSDGPFMGNEQGNPLIFRWHDVDALADLPLYPTFLRHALRALPDGPLHIVHSDPDG